MKLIPDNCQGCEKAFDVEQAIYEHRAMGVLCKSCYRFVTSLDEEVARLRAFAEQLAGIEESWTPRKVGGAN